MTTPGWYADPLNRYEMRFWDGQSWTANVHANGAQLIDPQFGGGSQTKPVAQPAIPSQPALMATAQGPSQSVIRLLDSMGTDARVRTTPSLATTLHGVGGALGAIALFALLVGEDGSDGTATIIAALIIAGATALRLKLSSVYAVSSATIGAVIVAIPLFAVGVGLSDDADNPFAAWLIATALYLAAWILPGFKGKTIVLGLGLFSFVGTLGSISGPVDCERLYDDDYSKWERLCDTDGILGTYAREVGRQGIIFLIGAAALLIGVWLLDRRGYRGTATGLIAAAMAAAVAGTVASALSLDGASGPLLVAIVGALVCFVGSSGERRATTWWGAAMAAIGTVAFLGVSMDIENESDFGLVALIAAAVLIFAPLAATAIAKSQSNT